MKGQLMSNMKAIAESSLSSVHLVYRENVIINVQISITFYSLRYYHLKCIELPIIIFP